MTNAAPKELVIDFAEGAIESAWHEVAQCRETEAGGGVFAGTAPLGVGGVPQLVRNARIDDEERQIRGLEAAPDLLGCEAAGIEEQGVPLATEQGRAGVHRADRHADELAL